MEYWNTEKLIFKRILSIFYFILNSDKKGRSAKISEGRGMKASGSPFGVKIDEKKKDHHPIYHLGKLYDDMMLFKLASID
jgi:hypothetical protein